MPLDPQSQKLLDEMRELGTPDYSKWTAAQARAAQEHAPLPEGPDCEVRDVQARGPGGAMTLRCYRPHGAGLLPAVLWFHGGGFVTGTLDRIDPLCRLLCVTSGCAVVSVDYRLAPEAKFPAAVNDCYTALCWVHENADRLQVDHHRLAVGGDSAGANLATVVARQAKERRGPPLSMQVLVYPVTDLRTLQGGSYAECDNEFLSREAMTWFRDLYLESPEQRADPRASPLAAQNLIGLPRALIITAEYDVLRDEGEAYAQRLREAGVQVELERYAGMLHGFVSRWGLFDKGRQAAELCGRRLRETLAPQSP